MTTIETTGLLLNNTLLHSSKHANGRTSFWQHLATFAQARERARRHRLAQAQLAALDERLLCDIGCKYLEARANRAPRYRPLAAPVLHIHAE
ncbi:hypothetical protein [Fodinicurvata fenggangensis]|uniref:hypothetical protein n=1 Tax=Fodinicurvata fenggangensis TaxID=1121830 RepID=UPI00047B3E8C|nr:hypothetical protein [Fodinicurvata fenggangensis]